MYLVEVVQLNRLVKVKARTEDYDKANDIFGKLKKLSCREVRFCALRDGGRVLLKYILRGRQDR